MSRMHTFASTFVVDVGTGLPPTLAPTAQGQWYRAFWIMWPYQPMAVAPLAHSIGKLTENQLCGLPASGEKVSLSEGLGKEYKKRRETKVGKTGTQAEGRHVVIWASQG